MLCFFVILIGGESGRKAEEIEIMRLPYAFGA